MKTGLKNNNKIIRYRKNINTGAKKSVTEKYILKKVNYGYSLKNLLIIIRSYNKRFINIYYIINGITFKIKKNNFLLLYRFF